MEQNIEPAGPFLDFSRRSDLLNRDSHTWAALAADYLLEGDFDKAREFAEKYRETEACIKRLWARHDLVKDRPERWIGWSVQSGYDSGAYARSLENTPEES